MIDLSRFDNTTFDRGASRVKETMWWFVRSFLFAPWFPVPSAFKVTALRAFGARVGRGVVIRSRVNITFPWRVEIGDQVWIGDDVLILSLDQVTIGSNVCLSQRSFLCTGSHDFSKDTFDLMTRPITIGESCWIGAQCFVAPGADLPAGTRYSAGSVVKGTAFSEKEAEGSRTRESDDLRP
ncbi:MAG: WcaF family extracellular polysaccharide biosynthesis acetyltransferase [Verrucomicrobiae bacterium]|nr:WcaF family extracellular polysaccharide biosynthesis acetyltransferase [Verrucomicrobiae bacterium]